MGLDANCGIHSMSKCNAQTKQLHIAINLTINTIVGVDKIYCLNIECPIIKKVYRSPESIYGGI